jgi:hypothetical protein
VGEFLRPACLGTIANPIRFVNCLRCCSCGRGGNNQRDVKNKIGGSRVDSGFDSEAVDGAEDKLADVSRLILAFLGPGL